MNSRKTLVVAGHGMVGHRLVEQAVARGLTDDWDVVVHAEEDLPAYDRVGLSSLFTGRSAQDLSLVADGFFDHRALDLRLGDPVVAVDAGARTVTAASGRSTAYDALVLATGSTPFVPPVPGRPDQGGSSTGRSPTWRRSGAPRSAPPAQPSSVAGCSAWSALTPCCRWVCPPPSWSSPRG